jgi:CxxC-x17-CxxC domain-containing protein
MGDFRPESRGRSGGGRQSRNSRFGGRRSGDFDRGDRRPVEMHEATCAKCGKQCEVPFRPTGDRPVLCSNCFRNDRDSGSRERNTNSGSAGISKEQFNELNTKLNKILNILESIDFEDEGEEDEDEESDEGSEEIKESEDKSE